MFNAEFSTAASHLARREATRVSARCQRRGSSTGSIHRDALLEAPIIPSTGPDPWEVSFGEAAMTDPRLSQTALEAAGVAEVVGFMRALEDMSIVGDFLEAPLAQSVWTKVRSCG